MRAVDRGIIVVEGEVAQLQGSEIRPGLGPEAGDMGYFCITYARVLERGRMCRPVEMEPTVVTDSEA